jgi:hypothetical protein
MVIKDRALWWSVLSAAVTIVLLRYVLPDHAGLDSLVGQALVGLALEYVGWIALLWFFPVVRHKNNNDHSDSNTN